MRKCSVLFLVLVFTFPVRAQRPWQLVETGRFDGQRATDSWTAVTSLLVTASNGFAVLDRDQKRIDIYDGAGKWLRQLGRNGSGPGEYRDARAIGMNGDTVWVADPVLLRLCMFLQDGKPVATLPLQYDPRDEIFGVYGPAGRFNNGAVLAAPVAYTGVLGQPASLQMPLYRISAVAAPLGEVVRMRVGKVVLELGYGTIVAFQPFKDGSLWSVDPEGDGFVVVHRAAAASPQAEFRLTKYAPSGRVVFDKYIRYSAVPLTGTVVDSAVTKMLDAFAKDPNVRLPDRGRVVSGLYTPAFVPPVSDLVATYDGHTLIRREATSSSNAIWEVYDSWGQRVGQFLLPSSSRALQLEGSSLWVAETDDLDVVTVVRYRVGR